MTTVQRYDYSQITAHFDDDGFLHDSPVVGRIGIQEYRNLDGSIRRELRLPEEVFNADSLASFVGKPITVDHPKSGKVDAKNAHRLTVGTMLAQGKQDGDTVRADVVIHSPDAIGDRRQLSLGYTATLDETPGEWNGQRYDAIQRNIKINHLSVVQSARAGAVARLNLDGNEEVFFNQQEQQTMTVKVKLDNGLEYDAAPEVSRELDKLRADAVEKTAQIKTVSDELSKAQAKADALQSQVDGFAVKLDEAKQEGKQSAVARLSLEKTAEGFKVDCADKTDREVKEAVIKSVRADANLEGKPDAYIDAAYDMAVEMKADFAMRSQRKTVNNTDAAGAGKPVSSREKQAAYQASLGKKDAQ